MFSVLRYLWITTRGYRWRPWKSPYLRWRIETYAGISAEAITGAIFWKFIFSHRKELLRFLRWVRRMHGLSMP